MRLKPAAKWCLFLAFTVVGLSLFTLASAGSQADRVIYTVPFINWEITSAPLLKQGAFAVAASISIIGLIYVPRSWFPNIAYIVYGFSLLLLILVPIIGREVNGSVRWLRFGPLTLQPSEFMKLGILFALARYFDRNPFEEDGRHWLRQLLVPFLLIVVPVGLVAKQPDLGTAIIIFSLGAAAIFFAGISRKAVLVLLLLLVIGAVPGWFLLHDYQRDRILTLLEPGSDPKGKGYHINQSKIAVGSGQFSGKGFGQGSQSQLAFVPEHTTDFIFSVFAEEHGFIWCLLLVVVYCCLLLLLLEMVNSAYTQFERIFIFGLFAMLAAHFSINLGMVMGLLPVVGITMPLFSYGGSSLITFLVAIGCAVSFSKWGTASR